MKKKLNLEPIDASSSQQFPLSSIEDQEQPAMAEVLGGNPGNQQPLTIFYNGQVSVLNVTDLQARTILYIARREMDGGVNISPNESEPPSPNVQPYPLCSPSSALSMKKSLQRFLQKRKNRLHPTLPHN